MTTGRRTPLFDFDGTLVDSELALTAPWHVLGVDPALVPLGLPLGEACDRAGVTVAAYLEHYDPDASHPFAGIADLLGGLPRWGLASNKERGSGRQELTRLGWQPSVALFTDDFDGGPKRLEPLLEAMELDPAAAVYVGDTDHDRHCAAAAGVAFAVAGWNPRAAARPGDVVLAEPSELLALLD